MNATSPPPAIFVLRYWAGRLSDDLARTGRWMSQWGRPNTFFAHPTLCDQPTCRDTACTSSTLSWIGGCHHLPPDVRQYLCESLYHPTALLGAFALIKTRGPLSRQPWMIERRYKGSAQVQVRMRDSTSPAPVNNENYHAEESSGIQGKRLGTFDYVPRLKTRICTVSDLGPKLARPNDVHFREIWRVRIGNHTNWRNKLGIVT